VTFLVFVHDVTVSHRAELDALWAGLKPRVGAALHAACIAGPAQQNPGPTRALLSSWSSETEIVAHGWSHSRRATLDPFSWATFGSDEFGGMPAVEAQRRVQRSREILEDVCGRPVRGFVPPAFRYGNLTWSALERAGYTYSAGLAWLRHQRGKTPLGTYAWDTGRLRGLALGLEAMGHLLAARSKALPCVVLHPTDVRWGLAPRAFARIDALLRQGLTPVRLSDTVLGATRPSHGAIPASARVSCVQ